MQEPLRTDPALPEASVLDGLTPTNRRLVLELANRLLALQDLQGLRPAAQPPPDLRPFLEDYELLLTLQGKAPATRRHHTFYANQLLTHCPSPTVAHIDAFLSAKLSAGVGPLTVRNIIFALKSFFTYLSHKGIIPTNPTDHLQLPRIPHRERIVPPPSNVARLFHSPITTIRDRVILHLLVDCGLRIGEIHPLRPTDIDLDASQVTVIGKGSKQRTVPFSPDTHLVLREYIARLPAGGRWLLPGRPPSKPLDYRYLEARLATLCKAAGIPHISPHQLRHFFATAMLNDGANVKVVSQLLGHSHASTTTDIYWHVRDADHKRQEHQQHNPLQAVLREL